MRRMVTTLLRRWIPRSKSANSWIFVLTWLRISNFHLAIGISKSLETDRALFTILHRGDPNGSIGVMTHDLSTIHLCSNSWFLQKRMLWASFVVLFQRSFFEAFGPRKCTFIKTPDRKQEYPHTALLLACEPYRTFQVSASLWYCESTQDLLKMCRMCSIGSHIIGLFKNSNQAHIETLCTRNRDGKRLVGFHRYKTWAIATTSMKCCFKERSQDGAWLTRNLPNHALAFLLPGS